MDTNRPHSHRLNAYQIGCFLRPCVYAWKREGRWLYVGKSLNGLARLGAHHVIALKKIEPHDELLVWWGPTTDYDLLMLEAALIIEHRPKFNRCTPRIDSIKEAIIKRRKLNRLSDADLERPATARPQAKFPIQRVVGNVPSGTFGARKGA